MAKCIVFGATGFIGSHLVKKLLADGHEVTTFGRRKYDPEAPDNTKLTQIIGDFLNGSDIDNAVAGNEYVFHFVTLTNPVSSDSDPFIDIETNVKMTIVLLEACVKHGVKRVIYPSSGGSVYGDAKRSRHKETDPTNPMSPYAIGKNTVENYLRYYHLKYNLDYLCLRVSNVYGEGQELGGSNHGIVAVFLNLISNSAKLSIFGDGSMGRDYIYVEDFVTLVARIFDIKKLNYTTYNIGSGEGRSILDVVSTIENTVGIKAKLEFLPAPKSFVQAVVLDCSRAQNEFGEFMSVPFEDGVRATWDYMSNKKHPDNGDPLLRDEN